jgi:hypothetical protein
MTNIPNRATCRIGEQGVAFEGGSGRRDPEKDHPVAEEPAGHDEKTEAKQHPRRSTHRILRTGKDANPPRPCSASANAALSGRGPTTHQKT